MDKIALSAALLAIGLPLGAATYYVDPVNGNDAAKGDEAAPWKTYAPVNKLELQPGDVVVTSPGRIVTTLAPKGSGESAKPIRLVFKPGRYEWQAATLDGRKLMLSNTNDRPDDEKKLGIELAGVQHYRLEGNGADMICIGKMIMVHFENSHHIIMKDMSWDYARPTVSEYTAVSVGEHEAVFTIHPDSRYRVQDGKLTWVGDGWELPADIHVQQMVREPRLEVWRGGPTLAQGTVEEIEPNKVRVTYDQNPGYRVGTTYQARSTVRECAGMFADHSSDIHYNNVHLYFVHGMGFLSQMSRDIFFQDISVAPREGSGRTCSAWVDMLHFSGVGGDIRVEKFFFSGAHDDAINVHGIHMRIVKILDPTHVRMRFMECQTWGFPAYHAGDEVDIIDAESMLPRGTTRVVAARMLEDTHEMELELADPLPEGTVENSDVLENVTYTASLTVNDGDVQLIPTRGFLITTRKPVSVTQVRFLNTHMHAILVSDDASGWYESGMVRDLTILNCVFDHCAEPVINILPENRVHKGAVHSGIKIVDNTFNLRGNNAINLKSAKDVVILRNAFDKPGTAPDFTTQKDTENVQFK